MRQDIHDFRGTNHMIEQTLQRVALSREMLRRARGRVCACRRSKAAAILNPQDRQMMNLLMQLDRTCCEPTHAPITLDC